MFDYVPETIGATVTAVLGGLALFFTAAVSRGRKSGQAPDPAEKMAQLIADNTAAMKDSNAQFTANNGLFGKVVDRLDTANGHLKEIERSGTEAMRLMREQYEEQLRQGRKDR